MELWIRSQSRQSLVKVDNVSITERTKEKYTIDSGDWILGRYKSYKRALEVLDEIQKILQPKIIINNTSDDSLSIIDGEWVKSIKAEMNYDTKELSTVVYEMPKE